MPRHLIFEYGDRGAVINKRKTHTVQLQLRTRSPRSVDPVPEAARGGGGGGG